VALTLVAAPAAAKIYKWVMPDGQVIYSDKPQVEGAKELKLSPLQLYHAAPTGASTKKPKKIITEGYKEFAVVAPVNDAVVRDNGGSVSVQLKLDPALRKGDRIEIQLDGKSVGKGTSTGLTLTNVDRGTHTVSAVIRDAKGNQIMRATGSTFHLKHAFRPPPPKPKAP